MKPTLSALPFLYIDRSKSKGALYLTGNAQISRSSLVGDFWQHRGAACVLSDTYAALSTQLVVLKECAPRCQRLSGKEVPFTWFCSAIHFNCTVVLLNILITIYPFTNLPILSMKKNCIKVMGYEASLPGQQLYCVGSLSKASKAFLELIMELQVM